jgi:hypothetical protein
MARIRRNKFREQHPKPGLLYEVYHTRHGELRYRRHRKDAKEPSAKQIAVRNAFANAAKKTKGLKGEEAAIKARDLVKKELTGAKFQVAEEGGPGKPVIPSRRRGLNLNPLFRALNKTKTKQTKPKLRGRLHFEGLGEE